MILALVVLLGFAGLVIDIGRVYVAQRQLQQAVDASALAAAQDLPDASTATTTANSYSAISGNKNSHAGFTAGNPTVTYKCLSSTGIPCHTDVGECNCNAVQVKETATVQSTFLGLFGVSKFSSVAATATVSMHGGTPHPLDIAVVMDTTGSMNSACGNDVTGITTGNSTKLDCAKEGMRALLSSLYPCDPSLASCGGVVNGNVAKPLDEVALFTFPGLTNPNSYTHDTTNLQSNRSLELGCPGGLTATPSWYTPNNDVNEVKKVTVNASTGTFKLQYNGGTQTVAINYNAPATGSGSPTSMTTALTPLFGSGNFTVTRASGSSTNFVYTITFVGSLAGQDVGSLTVSNNSTSGGSVAVTVPTTGSSPFPTWYLTGSDIGYSGASLSYQVVGLSSDYRSSDTASSLSTTSNLALSTSWSSCNGGNWPQNEYYGVNAPGGAGTYIAGAITAAQAALSADSARHATPVIIVLSDGDASTKPSGSTSPCHEAIAAADAAVAAGTEVYSIAYDADNTSGSCTQESSSYTNLTGFTTMQQIASDSQKFYCLNPPSGQTCNSASATSLKQIFTEIGIDVTNSRLVSDGTS